eukprot:4140305-Prymnesium_polylepis.3
MACAQRLALDPQADSDLRFETDADALSKVSPIPIGVGADPAPAPCGTLHLLRNASTFAPPLPERLLRIVAPFYNVRATRPRSAPW